MRRLARRWIRPLVGLLFALGLAVTARWVVAEDELETPPCSPFDLRCNEGLWQWYQATSTSGACIPAGCPILATMCCMIIRG